MASLATMQIEFSPDTIGHIASLRESVSDLVEALRNAEGPAQDSFVMTDRTFMPVTIHGYVSGDHALIESYWGRPEGIKTGTESVTFYAKTEGEMDELIDNLRALRKAVWG